MSTGNNMDGLRAILFDTLRLVKAGDIELDRARAVNELGKTLIESAKVEVENSKVNGGGDVQFLQAGNAEPLPSGITAITRHRLKG